jgi:putative heme-binding domain-containing protein
MEICRQLGARGDSRELSSLAGDITKLQATDSNLAGALLIAAIQGSGGKQRQIRQQLAEASSGATSQVLDSLAERSLEIAANDSAEPAARVAAIAALPLGEYAAAEPVLAELLAPRQPQQVQAAALAALGQFSDAEVAAPVLEAWPGLSPALRLQAADLLLSRGALAQSLLAAVDDHRLPARELDPSTVQRLKTHADSAVREQAARTMADSDQARSEIVESRRAVLDLAGELAHGREVFRQNCAICHRRDGFGTEVGADLATVVTRTPEALLISILDPNREVDPKYLQYTVLTVDGLAKSGMIAAETAASVTLKRAENVTETIPRSDIDELQSTGMTLMPEGFEKVLDDQSLADLIAYLRSTP